MLQKGKTKPNQETTQSTNKPTGYPDNVHIGNVQKNNCGYFS